MSADDATTNTPVPDAEPTHRPPAIAGRDTGERSTTRQTAAYWSMRRAMTDRS